MSQIYFSSGSSSGGGFIFNVVTATTNINPLVKSNGYISKGASSVVFVLPETAAVGDVFCIVGYGNLWEITQNAGQSITLGGVTSTVGTGGSVTATNQKDCIVLVCVTEDTEFEAINWVGNLTAV